MPRAASHSPVDRLRWAAPPSLFSDADHQTLLIKRPFFPASIIRPSSSLLHRKPQHRRYLSFCSLRQRSGRRRCRPGRDAPINVGDLSRAPALDRVYSNGDPGPAFSRAPEGRHGTTVCIPSISILPSLRHSGGARRRQRHHGAASSRCSRLGDRCLSPANSHSIRRRQPPAIRCDTSDTRCWTE